MSLQYNIEEIMAGSSIDSTTVNNNKSIHVGEPETSLIDEKVNTQDKKIKRTITSEQYRQLTDKLFEIEQIKCEEYFVHEQINRLNSEKQHLHDLLNLLYAMDSHDRLKKSRSRQRRLQKS